MMTDDTHTDDAQIEDKTPLLYVCMEDADGYEDACYAVRQDRYGHQYVSIVRADLAVELIDKSRHAMDDGGIVYPNLDAEMYDRLFVEEEANDVDVDDLSGHPL